MGADSIPVITYFDIQGLGECARYVLAAKGVSWQHESVDFAKMKAGAGSEEWPFGQAPKYSDHLVSNLSQTGAILRHLARVHDMYGADLKENACVDLLVDGVKDLQTKYAGLYYQGIKALDENDAEYEQKKASLIADYCKLHADAAGVTVRNGGAHFQYLENMVQRNQKSGVATNGFAVGNKLTIADTQVFYIVSLHMESPLFKNLIDFEKQFPTLFALAEKIKTEYLAEYLVSDKRFMS